MRQVAPTVGSAALCNTGCATGNGGFISRRKASRTTAGASSRHRGCRASMAIWVGRAPMPRSISSRPPQTISSAWVIARTKEAGLRGNFTTAGGRGDWKLGLFRIDSQNDIIQVASTLQGRGVFQNVPATRRQGLEAGAQYQTGQYLVYANYAFIDATYQFSGELASPNNPFADANGNIFVTPGKQIH